MGTPCRLDICRLDIIYGDDMVKESCLETLNHIKAVCDKWNVNYTIEKKERFCCLDYRVIKIKDVLSVKETEKFIEELDLNVSIYYKNEMFKAIYDNTYW